MKKTIIDLFENSVKQYPDNPFLWEKTKDAFEPTTYKEVQQQVYAAGAGLIALGVKKGDNMALLSEGRNAWIIGELAPAFAGAERKPATKGAETPMPHSRPEPCRKASCTALLRRSERPAVPSCACRCEIYPGFRQPAQKDTGYHG